MRYRRWLGFIKGKSAIHLARVYGERKQNYAGQKLLGARATSYRPLVGMKATIRDYIRNQEKEDQRMEAR